jgi:hypothetical protein
VATAAAPAGRPAQGPGDHRWPLVIDCTDRDQAGALISALISALAVLTARTDLAVVAAVGVVTHGDAPCQLRAVVLQLSRRRWWRLWTQRRTTARTSRAA